MLMAVHIRLLLGTLKLMVGVHVSRETFFVVSLFMYKNLLSLLLQLGVKVSADSSV